MQIKAITQLIKSKIFMIFFCMIFVSCTKQKTIEEILICQQDECWAYYSPGTTFFTYYKFDSNKFCNRYERDIEKKFYKYKGGDCTPEVPQKWSVSQDSILRWNGFSYDIVSYNENGVVLYCKEKDGKNEWIAFLTKEKESNPRKYSNMYFDKRINYPEKYEVPDSWWTSK